MNLVECEGTDGTRTGATGRPIVQDVEEPGYISTAPDSYVLQKLEEGFFVEDARACEHELGCIFDRDVCHDLDKHVRI